MRSSREAISIEKLVDQCIIMDFRVAYPQLEHRPGRCKIGVKRFPVRKNTTSAEFMLSKHFPGLAEAILGGAGSARYFSQPRLASKHQSDSRQPFETSCASRLPLVSYRSSKFIATDRNHNPLLQQYGQHPLFRPTQLTRLKPKLLQPSPITGLAPVQQRVWAAYNGN